MQGNRKYCLWLFLALACCHYLPAQVPDTEDRQTVQPSADSTKPASTQTTADKPFTVRTIYIQGNKRTRNDIILREIPFKPGEPYLLPVLVKKFEDARRQLMNTALFHEVIVALKSFEGYNIDVLVEVKERWYIFPIPFFKPVDRNLNQWLVEQKASLSRLNYGVKLLYNNATGRNDKLRLWLINGYTKQISFSYDRLYIDKKMKWGFNTSFSIGKNKEINYNTVNNKQVFLKGDNFLRNFMNVSAELTYRRAIKTRHRIGISYSTEEVSDSVIELNSSYFKSPRTRISYPEFYYTMTYYDLDYIPYPTKGYAAEVAIGKKGLNSSVNVWQLMGKGSASWHLNPKLFFTLGAYGTIKLPFEQPYFNQRLLGYSDVFLQGYEYYVIDGVAAGYLKAMFTRKLLNFNIKVPGTKKRGAQRVPFNIYGKIYGNGGYVHNPNPGDNSLSNKMLYSWGVGIDIITLYDFTLKMEWSFNQLGQNGLFLHRKTIF